MLRKPSLGCISDGERMKIQQRVFETVIQDLENQVEVGGRNFLAKSSGQMPKVVQHMYN